MEKKEEDTLVFGEKVYLRRSTLEDTDRIVRWRNSELVMPYFLYRTPFTKASHEKWYHENIDTGLAVQFIICEKRTDLPVGAIYFQHIDRQNRKAEYGLYLGEKSAYGRGIGAEAIRLCMAYGFHELGLHKIMMRALADNEASLRVNEKIGFRKEAYLKDELLIDGKYRDIVYMALFSPDE